MGIGEISTEALVIKARYDMRKTISSISPNWLTRARREWVGWGWYGNIKKLYEPDQFILFFMEKMLLTV